MTKSAQAKMRAATQISDAMSFLSAGVIAGLLVVCTGCSAVGTSNGVTTGAPDVGVYVIQNTSASGTKPASGDILEFSITATGSSSPVSSINAPTGTSLEYLAIDGLGNIYTSSQAANASAINEYSAGSENNAPSERAISFNSTSGLKAISALSSDAAGDIYASDSDGGISIFSAFATGSVAPSTSFAISSGAGPQATTVDAAGDLYVATAPPANNVAIAPIIVFPKGASSPARSIGGTSTTMTDGSPKALATDSAGNLYVANEVSGVASILVFGPGAAGNIAPLRIITGSNTLMGCVGGVAVDSEGYVYVVSTATCGNSANPTVLKFSTTGDGNIAPISSFTSKAWTNADAALSIAVY